MALVEFINDSAPYLNAENLNNNFNECDNIAEHGSNENGNYIKFKDGTLIQYGSIIQSANTDNVTITFPVAFINTNYVIEATSWYQWYRGMAYTRGDKNTTYTKLYPNYFDGSTWVTSTSRTPTIDWLAIGKWK